MTHTEYAAGQRLSVPCASWHLTFGGRCLNCGFDPERAAREREDIRERIERAERDGLGVKT